MGFLFLGRNSKATQRRTKMSDYEHPEVLVTTNWVAQNLNRSGQRLIEVDVDTASYDQGHIPGAVAWNWQTQLQDPIRRDLTGKAELERLLGESGISQDTTVLLYGDNNNWFAAYADENIRAHKEDVQEVQQKRRRAQLVDVRSVDEFTGKILAPPGLSETALRAGHIPGAVNIPWAQAANDDGTFKSFDELKALYESKGILGADEIIAYCRIGERSSHTWFVLKYLLGYEKVRNYDGSWTEWGNLVGAPIVNLNVANASAAAACQSD